MWRWRVGDPSLVPTCHGAVASAHPRLTKNSWFYLSAPETQCLLSGRAPLEVPPLFAFQGCS